MSHTALLEYIRNAKSRGASDADVSDRLFSAGWYRVDIQDGLELYRKMMPTAALASAPMPDAMPLSHAPGHSSSWPIVLVALVAFVMGFVGYLLLVK